jgi:hypothetical protein
MTLSFGSNVLIFSWKEKEDALSLKIVSKASIDSFTDFFHFLVNAKVPITYSLLKTLDVRYREIKDKKIL